MPLRPCVENPQDRFKHATRRDRFAPWPTIGNVLFRKMNPDPLPMFIAKPNHPKLIADRDPSVILR
jgi:hypothetical protein